MKLLETFLRPHHAAAYGHPSASKIYMLAPTLRAGDAVHHRTSGSSWRISADASQLALSVSPYQICVEQDGQLVPVVHTLPSSDQAEANALNLRLAAFGFIEVGSASQEWKIVPARMWFRAPDKTTVRTARISTQKDMLIYVSRDDTTLWRNFATLKDSDLSENASL
jgi:hypothetical protein